MSKSVNKIVQAALVDAFSKNPEFEVFGEQGRMRYESLEYCYRKIENSAERAVAIWVCPDTTQKTYEIDVAVIVRIIPEERFHRYFSREEIGQRPGLNPIDIPQAVKDLVALAINQIDSVDLPERSL
jgi:hypothetical protein